jgi:hypothetical protein
MRTRPEKGEVVAVQPLVTDAEREFLDGTITADAYLERTLKEEEYKVKRELFLERRRQRQRLAAPFGITAGVIYLALAIVLVAMNSLTFASIVGALALVVSLGPVLLRTALLGQMPSGKGGGP